MAALNPDIEVQPIAQRLAMSPLTGIIGAAQALEAVKLLSGYGEPLVGRLLMFDARYMEWHELALARSTGCPICGVGAVR